MIRFVVRWVFRALILGVVLLVGLILLKDTLAKAFFENRLRAATGLDVKIRQLELGLFAPTLTLTDFCFYNRPEFGGSPLVAIPDLHLEYNPAALAVRRLHLRLLRLTVPEINIVEARNGRTNLILALPDLDTLPEVTTGQETILGFSFTGIDTLNLSLGKVRYSSMRHPEKTTEMKLDLQNQVFTDVKSVAHLRQLVMTRLFRNGITITTDAPTARRRAPDPTVRRSQK